MKNFPKIAIISSCDISDRTKLSGVLHQFKNALEQNLMEVVIIDNLLPKKNLKSVLLNLDFAFFYVVVKAREFFWRLFSKKYLWDRTFLISRYYAKEIQKRLKKTKCDLILTDKGSVEIASLKTDIPIIYSSDATFIRMVDFYEEFTNLSRSSLREGNLIEQKAIDNAAFCFFHSKWAADSAVTDYGGDNKKVKVIYNGPNIEDTYFPSREDIVNKELGQDIRLLLIGVNWNRKGCDIALEAVESLNKKGIKSHLTICGCTPPYAMLPNDQVEIIPFLNKNKKEDLDKIVSLFRRSNFFIFPTRAECLGSVIIEACAFGLPSLGSRVGGVPEVVQDGFNGFVFPLQDRGAKYAEKIAQVFNNPKEYRRLSINAYDLYYNEFNWKKWANAVKKTFDEIL